MCTRWTHFVNGAAVGAVTSYLLPIGQTQPGVGPVVCAVLAASTAGGRFSPDMDQYGWWKRLDRKLPEEWLGFGGPMRHRGITHWWGLPAALGYLFYVVWPLVGVVALTVPLLLLVGWSSHIFADFLVGARYRGGARADARPFVHDEHGRNEQGNPVRGSKTLLDYDDEPRGPGVPLFPWWWHVGLGHRVGSGAEYVVFGASLVVLLAAVGLPYVV